MDQFGVKNNYFDEVSQKCFRRSPDLTFLVYHTPFSRSSPKNPSLLPFGALRALVDC